MPRWWFWGCLAVGLGVLVLTMRDPRLRQGNRAIYALAVAFDLIALADWNRYMTWSRQDSSVKIRHGGFAVIAAFMTVWSLLCIVGLITYRQ